MKKHLLFIFSLLTITNVFAGFYIPCKLVFKDSSILTGYAKIPDMMDKKVKYCEEMFSRTIRFPSDDLKELIFTQDTASLHYKRVLTYKNYGNKIPNQEKSWLRQIKSGYINLYYGFQPGGNSPSIEMWYCKKANDTIAYYISGAYSGALVMTIGNKKDFKQNASLYFCDYKELTEKILNSEYKLEDIELVVDLYNNWYENKDKLK